MASLFPFLLEIVRESTLGLPVQTRRMFGCDAFFVDDEIFALLWKTGRIGVKLTDPVDYAALLDLPGAEPWHAGPKAMSHWVLAPEELHDDPDALTPWIRRAHAQASARGRAPAAKKTAAKKTAAKKTAAKKTGARAGR